MGNTFMKVLPMSPNGCNLCPKTKHCEGGEHSCPIYNRTQVEAFLPKSRFQIVERHIDKRGFLKRIVIGILTGKKLVNKHLHLLFHKTFSARNRRSRCKRYCYLVAGIEGRFLVEFAVLLQHITENLLLVSNFDIGRHPVDDGGIPAQK